MTTTAPARTVSDAHIRRWLTKLDQPDKLAEDPSVHDVLQRHERLPTDASDVEVGQAAADLLREAIERLAPPPEASRQERLPYEVLRTCFLEGAKLFQAANKLGISERQMTRERTRAIKILRTELERPSGGQRAPTYRPIPIPAIQGFLPRPQLRERILRGLHEARLVRMHGPAGVGKSSLMAEIATELCERTPVFWYRFRPEVADTLQALLFELGEHLRSRRQPDLSVYVSESLPATDVALATRIALRSLGKQEHLLVFDDFHLVSDDSAVGGFLDEAIGRLPGVKIATLSRIRERAGVEGSLEVPRFTQSETHELLAVLGVQATDELAAAVQAWTDGIPQLVKLAASWLKTATRSEIAEGLDSLTDLEEVQDFLLGNITGLLGPDERSILEAASIFRDRFTDDALAFVADRTRGEVQDTSRRLVRAYIASRSRAGDVAFFHNSVREYVYDRLPRERRRELHERASSWYRRNGLDEQADVHAAAATG